MRLGLGSCRADFDFYNKAPRLGKDKRAEQALLSVRDLLAAQSRLLKVGTAVDASLIAAPTSNKDKDRQLREPPREKVEGQAGTGYLLFAPFGQRGVSSACLITPAAIKATIALSSRPAAFRIRVVDSPISCGAER